MRVLVCGSRGWVDEDFVAQVLDRLHLTSADTIVEGCARGADQITERVSVTFHINLEHHPVELDDWKRLGKKAGLVRNMKMLDSDIDLVVAFWDGESRGTDFTIKEAQRRKIPVKVYYA